MLEVAGVSKRFGGLWALSDCSFRLEDARVTAVIGPNGAGKTTLFNVISGLVKADAGRVMFRGEDILGLPPFDIVRKGIARTFQEPRVIRRLSVLENVLLARQGVTGEDVLTGMFRLGLCRRRERPHIRRCMEILELVGLAPTANEMGENLSFGDQKLLGIAQMLSAEADLLALDEPAAGLDEVALRNAEGLIRELVRSGKTIMLVEHNLHFVRAIADSVVFLHQGHVLAEGAFEKIEASPELADLYFGA